MSKMLFLLGILIPLFGTCFGSLFVFFLKNKISNKMNKLMIGFVIGVMLCASIFSLLIPSLELSSSFKLKWIPSCIGFSIGFFLLMFMNKVDKRVDKLLFSVTLHNIPEGLCVGVCFVSAFINEVSVLSAFLLSIGIAIQNIPEGMIISFPLRAKGYSNFKSFYYGFLSGVVEPLSSLITILFINYIKILLPYFLSFACGAMIYVIVDDLIKDIYDEDKNYAIIGILFGFIIMLILDVSFS